MSAVTPRRGLPAQALHTLLAFGFQARISKRGAWFMLTAMNDVTVTFLPRPREWHGSARPAADRGTTIDGRSPFA